METVVLPDDYLTASDELLAQANRHPRPTADQAAAFMVEAQVKAIQAVAAAIDRLATAVEALSPPSQPRPTFRSGGP
jgi:hypothetical protein